MSILTTNTNNSSGFSPQLTLSNSIYVDRARAILDLIDGLRGEVGLAEAINTAMDEFVDGESHPELRRFALVMVLARRQALLQQRLDDDRENLHHGHLSHDELVSTGHHYETLRHEACEYNHRLRSLIEANGQYFSRDELSSWLTAVSQGRGHWVKGEVSGAVSEIALHAALQGLPELRGLRYASLEEDLAGYDFFAYWQGEIVTIDAKTGLYAPLAERKHGHRHLEISVPREAVTGFNVTRRGLDLLRHEVREGLRSEAGAQVHAPHHYYQPARA
jgi:hypothetical protein